MSFNLKLSENRKIVTFDDEGYYQEEISIMINFEECFLLKVRKENIKEIYINPEILFLHFIFYFRKKRKN